MKEFNNLQIKQKNIDLAIAQKQLCTQPYNKEDPWPQIFWSYKNKTKY